VAEHDDLELFELLRTEAQRRELQKAPKHEVAQRLEQEWLLQVDGTADRPYGRKPHARRWNRVNAPHKVKRRLKGYGRLRG
jgi:hypothetical protein